MRLSTTILIALAMLAPIAGPAAAKNAVAVHQGWMRTGKFIDHCSDSGTATVSGGGLGLPLPGSVKHSYYEIEVSGGEMSGSGPSGLSVVKESFLNACGQLGPVGRAPNQLGGACYLAKGHNGKGRVSTIYDEDYYLRDISWKTPVGGTILFTASGQYGEIAEGASGTDLVTGLIAVTDPYYESACSTKHWDTYGLRNDAEKREATDRFGQPRPNGARNHLVHVVLAVVNGAYDDPHSSNTTPGVCKGTNAQDADLPCAYDEKPTS